MGQEDVFRKIVPMQQDGWSYMKPFLMGQNQLLIIYNSGQLQGSAFEARNIKGYGVFQGKDDIGRHTDVELRNFSCDVQPVESDLGVLTEKYMNWKKHNVVHSDCDKKPEDIARQHFYNIERVMMEMSNWAILRAYKRENGLLEEQPICDKESVKI